MNIDPLYAMALLTGLMGSGHCLGMCGPLLAALGLAGKKGFFFHLAAAAGRIAGYGAIGALAGRLGAGLIANRDLAWPAFIVLLLSDLLVIAVGLGVAGVFRKLSLPGLECLGAFGAISRVVRKLAELPAPLAGLGLGLIMGLLPCGFLYAMFITAGQSGSAVTAAITMLFFGLGTAPSLLLFGSAAHLLSTRTRTLMLRAAGLIVVAMGLYNLYRHLRIYDWLIGQAAFPWCCYL